MSIKIGICGAGRFGRCFVPLFQAHPLVGELVLADLIRERAAEEAARCGIDRTAASLDELCATLRSTGSLDFVPQETTPQSIFLNVHSPFFRTTMNTNLPEPRFDEPRTRSQSTLTVFWSTHSIFPI